METKTTAKDFFLHLGVMVTLYTTAISFLNLLFRIINKVFPEVGRNVYYWGGGSEISLPVATLIVAFPLFLIIGKLTEKTYLENPEKKNLAVRKWLIYITLFITGIAFAGDLISVIYKFLDGQDLTAAFILKALAVLVVSGSVFYFCLQDVRNRISVRQKKIVPIVVICVLLAVVAWGFAIFGSPKTQRLMRVDGEKISDLQNVQWQIINYWQNNGSLPETWETPAIDSQTGKAYEYKKTGTTTFELCAEFNHEGTTNQNAVMMYGLETKSMMQNNNWDHEKGRHCFPREIDPIAYPEYNSPNRIIKN